MTHGYRTRRLAVDYSIPLVTDIKCAKLLIEAMRLCGSHPPMKTNTDCVTSRRMLTLPGFIDAHVHVRDPGATHKEDWSSCTAAALAGGITMILAMPNTNPAITDHASFQTVIDISKLNARCDYALFVGASNTNYTSISELAPQAAAMKMYLNKTFTTLQMDDMGIWRKHLEFWPKNYPLCVHAVGATQSAIILLASMLDRPLHICHVSTKDEILMIKLAKERGVRITCEVTPHHLFLSQNDVARLGVGRSAVCPSLNTLEDQRALWDNMDVIDCFATDHAPHTTEEKDSEDPPPGFPGLETCVPLLLNAVNEGRLKIEDLINKLHVNPKRIFNLPDQPNTYVEVDMDDEWVIPNSTKFSKAQWTPFAGFPVKGSVKRVVLRGEPIYVDGEMIGNIGYGQNVREWKQPVPKTLPSTLHHGSELLDFGKSKSLDAVPRLDGYLWETDIATNEVFTKLLAEQMPVHLSVNYTEQTQMPLSPIPRVRVNSVTQSAPNSSQMLLTQSSGSIPTVLHHRNIISVDMFTKDHLNDIFNLGQILKARVVKERPVDDILRGKVMACVFYEPSTRTSSSFTVAMQRLGGRVVQVREDSSSSVKGESLEDTIATLSGYCDVVVLRHPKPGAVTVSLKIYHANEIKMRELAKI